MRVFAAFLLALLLACPAMADQWINEQYRLSWELPKGENWQTKSNPSARIVGDVIYMSLLESNSQYVTVTVHTNIPTDNLANPAVMNRILECVVSQGFAVDSHDLVRVDDVPWVQMTGSRRQPDGTYIFAIAKATLRANTIIVALTCQPGTADTLKDERFLSVLDGFKLLPLRDAAPPPNPYQFYYRVAWRFCAVAAAGLMGIFVITWFFSRRRFGM